MEKGLLAKVDELYEEKEGKKKKKKPFKLSFGLRTGAKSKIRTNQVLAFIIRTNGNFDIKWLRIENNMVYLKENDTYHEVDSENIKYYKKFPYILLPEDNLRPVDVLTLNAGKEDTKASDQRVIIRASKLSQLKQKKSVNGKAVFIGLIVVSVILYLLYNSGVT